MRRRQLIEIHEQAWCPAAVREGATDCLQLIAVIGRQFRGAVDPLRRALAHADVPRIVDLGAGAGGPWRTLYPALQEATERPIRLVLTDLYPNVSALQAVCAQAPESISFVAGAVDATNVPIELSGVRTLFTSFHHFAPATAQAILQDAVDARQPIALFEQTHRSLAAMLFMVVLAPIAFLAVPLIRPFRWSRLFWTYLIPAIPFVLLFDGIVSCWRTYTAAELREMTAGMHEAYEWEVGRVRTALSPLGMSYLIGYPNEGGEGRKKEGDSVAMSGGGR